MRVTIPVTEDSSGLRSGFRCAIGVLASTFVGETMVRGYGHFARRSRVIRLALKLLCLSDAIEVQLAKY